MLGRIALTNRLVSKKLDVDERLVASVMDFCLKELDKEFYEMNHPYLYVKGLGTFGINLTLIDKRLRFVLPKYGGFKRKVASGFENKSYFNLYKGLQEEIFFLFKLRRKIKAFKRRNNKLKKDGRDRKALANSKRELLQTDREESGAL